MTSFLRKMVTTTTTTVHDLAAAAAVVVVVVVVVIVNATIDGPSLLMKPHHASQTNP